MRKNLILMIAAVLAALALLSGGTDKADINRMIFVTGIGIDIADEGLRCTFYTAVPTGSDKAVSENNVSYEAVTITSSSLGQAVRQLERGSARSISLEHLNCTAIGQTAHRENLPRLLDHLLRETSVRRQCTLLMLDTSAEDFFSAQYDGSIASRAAALIEQQDDSGQSIMTLGKLSSAAQSGNGYTMYILDIPSAENTSASDISAPADIKITGMALFDRHGMTGRLSERQSELARLFSNRQASGIITSVDSGGRQFSYEITYSKCRQEFQPGLPAMGRFDITVECVLIDSGGASVLPDDLEISEALRTQLWELMTLGRNVGSAFTGLEAEAMQSHLQWYMEHGDSWENIYSSAVLELNVDCKTEHRSG